MVWIASWSYSKTNLQFIKVFGTGNWWSLKQLGLKLRYWGVLRVELYCVYFHPIWWYCLKPCNSHAWLCLEITNYNVETKFCPWNTTVNKMRIWQCAIADNVNMQRIPMGIYLCLVLLLNIYLMFYLTHIFLFLLTNYMLFRLTCLPFFNLPNTNGGDY